MKQVLGLFLLFVLAIGSSAGAEREQIGTVLGESVYRDQLAGEPGTLLVAPAMKAFFANKQAEITPTEAEITTVVERLMAEKSLPMNAERARGAAMFLLASWKLNVYIYDNFGGGRLLFQQAGVEAFDATRRLIEHLEAEKLFTVDDPELRASIFAYWTRDHSPFLTSDEAAIAKWRDFDQFAVPDETR